MYNLLVYGPHVKNLNLLLMISRRYADAKNKFEKVPQMKLNSKLRSIIEC